jgi:signal transduction histidine kinase
MAAGLVDILVQFSRLASEASSGDEIIPLLADAAIDHVKADGAVVVQLLGAGARAGATASTPAGSSAGARSGSSAPRPREEPRMRVVAVRGLPEAISQWTGDPDLIGDELAADLLRAVGADPTERERGSSFERAVALPLMSRGGLFGALVLFFRKGHEPNERRIRIGHGLADLAAVALGRAAHIAKLTQANAELRASREALARTEKLRALGQMAAGLSHDLKNILNPLLLHAQIAQRAIARGDTAQINASIEECKSVIRRGVETLDRLRTFSRQSPESRAAPVDLNALAREAIAIARPRMSSGAGTLSRIVEDFAAPPSVLARADEVVAAVVNLVVNAIDAMPGGGTITVQTGEDGEGAFICVSDTGPGMTPEVQARVFEPFFTTKGADGTGLGLAMVFATMQRCGGSVSLETAPGKGAAFTLSFPVAAAR